MNFRATLSALCVSLACAQSFTIQPVSAQEADAENSALETITVTAQKRRQNSQTVPVAVTVIGESLLKDTVAMDIYDIDAFVPAFDGYQSQSATNASFSIRGIGTSSQNFGFEPSVGLYVDGIYRARQNAVINDFVDMEAIEILRGPQGTLFGKNTPAGAVVFRSKAPTFENGDGFIRASVGSDNLRRLSGASSINAIDNVLALRVAGFSHHRDGYISDAASGASLNNKNREGVKIQALYTPTDALRIKVIADYATLDERCCGALTWLDNRQAENIPGKFGTDALLMQPPFNATLFTRGDFYDYRTALSAPPRSKMTDSGLSAEIDWTWSGQWRFVSLTGYRDFHSLDVIDTDFTDANLLNTTNDAQQYAFSQELQAHYSSDGFNGLFGAYFYRQSLDLHFDITTQGDFPAFFAFQSAALAPLTQAINGLSALTGGLIAPVADAAPAGTAFAHTADQQQKSVALFAHGDWQLTPDWSFAAGVRYTRENKTLDGTYTETGPGISGLPVDPSMWPSVTEAAAALPQIGAALASGALPSAELLATLVPFQQPGWGFYFLNTASVLPRPATHAEFDDNQITGSVKLSWQGTKNTLVYASFATGYKAGGTNTDRISPAFDPVFGPEKAKAFEAGIKRDWPAYRLRTNLAAHITRIDDFQASTFTGTGFNLQNAGKIDIKGLEAEIFYSPRPDTQIRLAASRTLATFDEFTRGTCWVATPWHSGLDDPGRVNAGDPFCDRSGDNVGFTPQNALSLRLTQHLEIGSLPSQLSVDYQYQGSLYLDDTNDPYKYSPAYQLINLQWRLHIPQWQSSVTLWGRNILDEEYAAKSGFDVPVQTGKIMAYPGEPASVGLTVEKQF